MSRHEAAFVQSRSIRDCYFYTWLFARISLFDFTRESSYNICMRDYNIFTWLIDFPVKPLVYKCWIYIGAPVIFVMWLCVQFVFKDLLYYWAAYVFVPVVSISIVWDCINYIRYVMIGRKPKGIRHK